MSLGLEIFTAVHVAISLVGIFAGLGVVFAMMAGNSRDSWTSIFLWSSVLTSVTGYFFPFHGFKPSYVVGAISLVVLGLAIFARRRHQAGAWRWIFVVTSVTALYLNVFVLVVQLFLKVPALQTLAPTQTEPPFKMAQLAVLILFAVMGIISVKKFPAPAMLRTEKP